MTRYIDADALIEDIQETICAKCGDISDGIKCKSCGIDDTIDFLENAPTADVVPKSEVELDFTEEEIMRSLREADIEVSDKSISEIKTEVARKIFEDIKELEKKYTDHKQCPNCRYFVGCEKTIWTGACDEYAEVKNDK